MVFSHKEWMSCNIDAGRHQEKGHITNGTIQLGSFPNHFDSFTAQLVEATP